MPIRITIDVPNRRIRYAVTAALSLRQPETTH
jgi:hypothetical protein